ncbi:hypothetical protein [Engelhardtia mirabilis]
MELYAQACNAGLAQGGEAGQLEFFSLTNRALCRGNRPGALLTWLLREKRADWITQADEDAAATRLREFRDGPAVRSSALADLTAGVAGRGGGDEGRRRLSPEEAIVERCIRLAKNHRIADPFTIARRAEGWTRDQWDLASLSYETTQARQWYREDDLGDEIDRDFAAVAAVTSTWKEEYDR